MFFWTPNTFLRFGTSLIITVSYLRIFNWFFPFKTFRRAAGLLCFKRSGFKLKVNRIISIEKGNFGQFEARFKIPNVPDTRNPFAAEL